MKRILYSIILSSLSIYAFSQVTTPLSLGEGSGVRLYTLEQILDSARQNNIAIRTARHDIEAASQQRREAFTKYFPNVSATGLWFNANKGTAEKTLNPSEMISPKMGAGLAQMLPAEALAAMANPVSISLMKHGTFAGITAMQPVFAGGQIVNGNRLARVGEEAARLQLQLTENEVESQRLKLQNGISIVRLLMAQYCGLRDTSFVLSHNPDAVPVALQTEHQQALLATPEYQLLDKQVEATNLQRKMEIGKNLPTVAVGAGYNYHTLLDCDHSFGMIFATVSVPISDWWGGSHAIRRKKIAYQQAQEQLTDKAQLLTIRMQNAWNSVVESQHQLAIARRSIEQAEENLRLHRDYYRAGTCKMSDLLEAQLLYQQSCDKHTDAFADLQNKILEYKQSTGQ